MAIAIGVRTPLGDCKEEKFGTVDPVSKLFIIRDRKKLKLSNFFLAQLRQRDQSSI